jgi:hypothetical protein
VRRDAKMLPSTRRRPWVTCGGWSDLQLRVCSGCVCVSSAELGEVEMCLVIVVDEEMVQNVNEINSTMASIQAKASRH